MKLLKPCTHGRFDNHYIDDPEDEHGGTMCAGGQMLADGVLVIEKVNGEWPEWVHEKANEINQSYAVMTSGRFIIPVTAVLDVLLDGAP